MERKIVWPNPDHPKHDRLDKPVCDACAFGLDEMEAKKKKDMEKYGWYAHFVIDDNEMPFGYNIHTHGLYITYKHLDLQICCPLPMEVAHDILSIIVKEIKDGDVFSAGARVSGIIRNYDVLFVEATENDRPVLRVILPDPTGCLDKDEMDPSDWAQQYNGTKP